MCNRSRSLTAAVSFVVAVACLILPHLVGATAYTECPGGELTLSEMALGSSNFSGAAVTDCAVTITGCSADTLTIIGPTKKLVLKVVLLACNVISSSGCLHFTDLIADGNVEISYARQTKTFTSTTTTSTTTSTTVVGALTTARATTTTTTSTTARPSTTATTTNTSTATTTEAAPSLVYVTLKDPAAFSMANFTATLAGLLGVPQSAFTTLRSTDGGTVAVMFKSPAGTSAANEALAARATQLGTAQLAALGASAVSASDPAPAPADGPPIAIIAGAAGGGVVLLALLVLLARRLGRKAPEEPIEQPFLVVPVGDARTFDPTAQLTNDDRVVITDRKKNAIDDAADIL